jgi:acyl dehydratase
VTKKEQSRQVIENPDSPERMAYLEQYHGSGERVSPWVEVTQELVDKFSEATLDPDWMHIDPERARRDGPFDGTIAFGFWTLSMLTSFLRETTGGDYPPGVAYGFNYGLDRCRLMAPVPIGSRVRNHFKVVGLEDKGQGRFVLKSENRVEIEGQDKPAMVAGWLGMLVFPD